MPKTIRWTAAADQNYADKDNWIDMSTGSAPAAGPDDDDTILFAAGVLPPTSNNTGQTQTGIHLIVGPGFAADLTLGTTSFASVQHEGLNIDLSGNVTGTAVLKPHNGAKSVLRTGTAARVVSQGDITVMSAVEITTEFIGIGPYAADIAYNAANIDSVVLDNDFRADIRRSALVNVKERAILKMADAATLETGSKIDGALDYRASNNIGGTIDVGPRGRMTLANNPNVITIATVRRYPGSQINYTAIQGVVTPSTETWLGINKGTNTIENGLEQL